MNKHDICLNCGHYYHLHNLTGKCDACSDPTVDIKNQCPQFILKEDKNNGK